ncbi:MAG TPA: hypothetical protein ENH28_08490 [Euryarchaeota archaeon]|nr:hypothetical protein BMS3Bbin15_00514 [archaeon BMS3Bbin15]HDL16170.1 hypothetical protein [Euryarchaeota archaeon]
MNPIKVYKDTVDIKDLIIISKNYIVRATDGKLIFQINSGKIISGNEELLKNKKEMIVALYKPDKKIKLKNCEYLVTKVDYITTTNISESLDEISQKYDDIIINAFSKKARKVSLVFKNGNLVYWEGNYQNLLIDNRAILDIYEIFSEPEVFRNEIMQRFKLKEPSDEEVTQIIKNAMDDRYG